MSSAPQKVRVQATNDAPDKKSKSFREPELERHAPLPEHVPLPEGTGDAHASSANVESASGT